MQTASQEFWKKRNEKLQTENKSLKEKLTQLKSEINHLQKTVTSRESLIHSIPDGVVLLHQGKIIEINETALQQLGYGAEEVIGRDFLDFVHPAWKAFVRKINSGSGPGKSIHAQYEAELVTKSGEIFPCDVRAGKIRFKGRTAQLITLTPNEERRRREEELVKDNKREAFIAMATGLKRELSPSLNNIIENIREIKDLGIFDNKDLRKRVENIESACSEIMNTSRKLDSLSKRDNARADVVLFDLKKVVETAVSIVNPKLEDLFERRDLTINLKTYLRSVSPVEGDPDEIRDVIVNLILNAAEAMHRGGELYVTTEENAGYAHIYVQDGGMGISENIKDRIFDPFCTTKKDGSVGLGLSISYAIIRRHKGEIEVTSQKDQGTIFTVKLPLAGKKKESRPRLSKNKIKNALILVIEEEGIIRELLSQILLSKGFRVVTATNGLEGLHSLRRKPYDLVLADLETVVQNGGGGLIRKMKKMNRALPIVLMAGNEKSDTLNNHEGSEVDLVIRKPIDMNRVVKQVTDVLMMKGAAGEG